MKNHDESKDVRLISRIAKVDTVRKMIVVPVGTTFGLKTLGRLDYLCNHKGYFLTRSNKAVARTANNASESKKTARDLKKARKEPKLTDKTKKKK